MSATRRVWFLHGRLLISTVFEIAIFVCTFTLAARMPTRIIVGWDAGVLLYLVLFAATVANSTIDKIKWRAAVYDEGALIVLLLTAAAAVASLAAVFAELAHAPSVKGISMAFDAAIGIVTILLSWFFMHSVFALHYAHEFYGEGSDRKMGGLTFPGDDDPDYWDFLYYSLVIAMTAQVSDVQIASRTIRWSTTFHAIVSFFFNVAILALGVNIASNLLQGPH